MNKFNPQTKKEIYYILVKNNKTVLTKISADDEISIKMLKELGFKETTYFINVSDLKKMHTYHLAGLI